MVPRHSCRELVIWRMKPEAWQVVQRAEELGFSRAWF